jgi:phosphatidylserine decarboxylase
MTQHKEGRRFLIFSLIIFVGIFFLFEYALAIPKWVNGSVLVVLIILYLVILQFFLSPRFIINRNEQHFLAPADGKIIVIEDTLIVEENRKGIEVLLR